MVQIVLQKPFVKDVENYVFKNDQKYAKSIALKKNSIPKHFRSTQTLYRGMILSEELVKAIQNGYAGFKLDAISSWTTDKSMAEKFAFDKSKITKGGNGVGVIFRKRITEAKIILNLKDYVSFLYFSDLLKEYNFDESTKDMALEESEVLVDKGISLKKIDMLKVGK